MPCWSIDFFLLSPWQREDSLTGPSSLSLRERHYQMMSPSPAEAFHLTTPSNVSEQVADLNVRKKSLRIGLGVSEANTVLYSAAVFNCVS